MRRYPDPTQVEPIRVPAGLNCHVEVISFVRVTLAGSEEQPELMVVEIEHVASKFGGKLGSPRPVVGIGNFVDSPRVVENGEQGNDFEVGSGLLGQPQAIFKDSCPVRNAVIAAQRQGVVFEDGVKDRDEIHVVILPLADDIYDGFVLHTDESVRPTSSPSVNSELLVEVLQEFLPPSQKSSLEARPVWKNPRCNYL